MAKKPIHTTIKLNSTRSGLLSLEANDHLHDKKAAARCAHAAGWTKRRVEWKAGKNVVAWKVIFTASPFESDDLVFDSRTGPTGGTILKEPADPWYKYTIEFSYLDSAGNEKEGDPVDPKIVIEDSGDGVIDLLQEVVRWIGQLGKPPHCSAEAVEHLRDLSKEISKRLR